MLITKQVKGRDFTRLSCSGTSAKSQGEPIWLKTGYKLRRSHSLLGVNSLSGSQKSLKGLYYSWPQVNYHRYYTPEEQPNRHTGKAQKLLLLFWVHYVCLFAYSPSSWEANVGTQDRNLKEGPETENTYLLVHKGAWCLLAGLLLGFMLSYLLGRPVQGKLYSYWAGSSHFNH